MKDLFMKYVWQYLSLKTISLASLLVIFMLLTPVFNVGFNVGLDLFEEVKANGLRLDAHDELHREHKDFTHMLNEKVNLLLINDGIAEYRIKAIENNYKNKGE